MPKEMTIKHERGTKMNYNTELVKAPVRFED